MDNKCYIIMGTTGDYEDAYDWPARVFLEKATAEKVCEDFNAWLREHNIHYERGQFLEGYADVVVPFDPYFSTDYTGAKYHVTECIFNDIPPTQDDINETYEVD